MPEMLRILELCVELRHSQKIALSYNTNLTTLPKRVKTLWPHFRSVNLYCSIDGYGRLNEYIRRPSRWSEIDRNLHEVDQNFRQWKMKSVFISATVQNYNILDLDGLYGYLRSRFDNILPLPNLVPLYEPKYLCVQSLPTRIKDLAREKLLKEKTHKEYLSRQNELSWLLDNIDSTINFMYQDDLSHNLDDFRTFTRNSDRKFGDDLTKVAPELVSLLEKA